MQTRTLQFKVKKGDSDLMAAPSGNGDNSGSGALLAGNVTLEVNDSNGLFTSDELNRINDAIAAINATVSPYGVTISEVDSTYADTPNIIVDTGTTCASGGFADGVLGCTTDAGEITLIQGWNFYAGSDVTQIGSGQYDFQTVVTHELGHALGLGHRTDVTSVMFPTLNTGTANHVMVKADLQIPDTDPGACGLHALLPHAADSMVPEIWMVSLGNATGKSLGIHVPDSSPSRKTVADRSSQHAALDALMAEWATNRPVAGRDASVADTAKGKAPAVRKVNSPEQLVGDEIFSVVW